MLKQSTTWGSAYRHDAPDVKSDFVTIGRYDFTGAPFDFIIGMSALGRCYAEPVIMLRSA